MPSPVPDHLMRVALGYHQAGRLSDAEPIYRQIICDEPNHPDALYFSGLIAAQLGKVDQAIALFERAVAVSPGRSDAWLQLGIALRSQHQWPRAIACFQRAAALKPEDAQLHYILANALQMSGHYEQAISCYRRALDLKPDYANAVANLGSAYKQTGQLDQAIVCYRRALRLKPDSVITDDNLQLALLYHPDSTPETLFAESCRWSDQHEKPIARPASHTYSRDPARRLRIGYVSPDFGNHPVGRFMLPLLSHHNRAAFDIYCYSQIGIPDEMTGVLQSKADQWRNIFPMSDPQTIDAIREDQIDILVNLAVHTAKNRLAVFANKPAPMQVIYLGYAGGCGMRSVDYRVTDPYLDPDPGEDRFYLQKSYRLSGSYWCYQPAIADLDVDPLPASNSANLTLGCLNNFSKITDSTLDLWTKLLCRLPTARLLMHAPAGSHRDRIVQFFQHRNVVADRLEFVDRVTAAEYLRTYHRIDIALDPFPFAGGTTTCDALWMGVPVITLAGRTPAGRAGVSILSNAGFPEWIARTGEEYVEIVCALAANRDALANVRASLRGKLQTSRLTDVIGYVASVESAYRTIWQHWCEHE